MRPARLFTTMSMLLATSAFAQLSREEYATLGASSRECTTPRGSVFREPSMLLRDFQPDLSISHYHLGGPCESQLSEARTRFVREDLARIGDLFAQWCSSERGYALKPGAVCMVGYEKCVAGHWEQVPDAHRRWLDHVSEIRAARERRLDEIRSGEACSGRAAASQACGWLGTPCDVDESCVQGLCVGRTATQQVVEDTLTEKALDHALAAVAKNARNPAVRSLARKVVAILGSTAFQGALQFLQSENEDAPSTYGHHLADVVADVSALATAVVREEEATVDRLTRAEANDLAGVSRTPQLTKFRLSESVRQARERLGQHWQAAEAQYQGMLIERDVFGASKRERFVRQHAALKALVEDALK